MPRFEGIWDREIITGRIASGVAVLASSLRCYEKVKGEISLFRGFVDKLKVFSIPFATIDNRLLSVGIGYVGSIGERFCFCFAV